MLLQLEDSPEQQVDPPSAWLQKHAARRVHPVGNARSVAQREQVGAKRVGDDGVGGDARRRPLQASEAAVRQTGQFGVRPPRVEAAQQQPNVMLGHQRAAHLQDSALTATKRVGVAMRQDDVHLPLSPC